LIEQFELVPCSVCARKFRADIIEKHENICMKASKRRPKIFDSGKMRAKGTDERLIRAEKKRDNWRIKHREFINTIRSAKAYQNAASKGGSSLSRPLPPPTIDPDLIQCQYCNRRFNESAAERHIPFCKEKSEREKLKQMANRSSKKVRGASCLVIPSNFYISFSRSDCKTVLCYGLVARRVALVTAFKTKIKGSQRLGRSVTQQAPKSPATPKGGKGDGRLGNSL
uniref:Zinc finger C2HC domain-containing protein 1B n=1 Tax=Taenia asiatica TaxID=60517 RepID=A0A0R3WAI9_TAEAS